MIKSFSNGSIPIKGNIISIYRGIFIPDKIANPIILTAGSNIRNIPGNPFQFINISSGRNNSYIG